MYYVGIDLGGTNIKVGLVNENREILLYKSIPTLVERGFDEILKDMAELVDEIIKEAGLNLNDIKHIGIGMPGVVDNELGTVNDNSNIRVKNYPIRQRFQQYIDKPVFLGNDANVAAWAEYICGCGKNTKNFLMLTLGTGVGGGIVLNGKLFTGSHNIGAEIGHTTFIEGGNQCGCGKKGCVEAYCSAAALIKMAQRDLDKFPDSVISKAEKINARLIIDAAKNNDKFGVRLFNEYASNLAKVCGSLINFLDPDVIALGGGVANAGDFLIDKVNEEAGKYVLLSDLMNTKILKAQMGNDAGIIGAALLGEL